MKDVAQEARRRRNDRGYKEGSWPDVLEGLGLEHVPKEEKRKWLLEKRAMIKKR
ncbi:hypothetical protein M407DRAFT_242462 [Tulasnella calospora MUT 4182]|uniref:Uncharacterized protein n=1 Tax=Tulasnella calospora MUT 4182 TaxID=1051891 RepID=A0A0C3QF61_9AGAM|nr:hypothetical protein M407DRAFT_242462 [Tulasnella calospora MUT 4182]